jgi:hypothetical protein
MGADKARFQHRHPLGQPEHRGRIFIFTQFVRRIMTLGTFKGGWWGSWGMVLRFHGGAEPRLQHGWKV